MRTFLKPIDPRMLADSLTIFNALGKGDLNRDTGYLATVIRKVSFAERNLYSFNQSGTDASNPFCAVICCTNSDFGGLVYVPSSEWARLTPERQLAGRFTLHRGMWLLRGEHASIPDGTVIPSTRMSSRHFSENGLRLLKTGGFSTTGLGTPHHFTLEG